MVASVTAALAILLGCQYVYTKPYDFVLGWSTGHVGTTTLSSATTYSYPSSVRFIFEGERNPIFLRSLRQSWMNFTHEDERKFVKDHFIPKMLDFRGNTETLVDLGHHNLYFIHGLIGYLARNQKKYKVLFIRIRRERYESALSLIHNHPNEKHASICEGLLYRYCPSDRVGDIILKPKSVNDWMKQLTEYQKALWMVDEVEARWQSFVNEYPFLNHVEVYWSSSIPNSIKQAAYNISVAMQLNLPLEDIQPVHLKTHAFSANSRKVFEQKQIDLEDYRKLDEKYKSFMRFNANNHYNNGSYINSS